MLSWGSPLGCSVGTSCILPWDITPVPIKYHLRGGEGGKKILKLPSHICARGIMAQRALVFKP